MEITINSFFIYSVFATIIIIAFLLFYRIKNNFSKEIEDIKAASVEKESIIRERDLLIRALQSEVKERAQDLAINQFNEWKTRELIDERKKMEEAILENSKYMLRSWIMQNEERIRKDAANRSVRNVMGRVTEQLLPFSEAMSLYNPKDARFLGSPIDLIVFDGSEELKEEISIIFIEVKTGTSALSKRQRLIKDAIDKNRVYWKRVDMKDFGEDVNEALKSGTISLSV